MRRGLSLALLFGGCHGGGGDASDVRGGVRYEAEACLAPDRARPVVGSLVGSGGSVLALASGGSATFLTPSTVADAAAAGDTGGSPPIAWWRVAAGEAAVGVDYEWHAAADGPARPLATGSWHVPAGAHPECLDWRALGSVPASARRLVLRLRGDAATLRLDQFAFMRGAESPAAPAVTWASADGELELRAAAGARVSDPEWTLKLLQEARTAVAARLGVPVAGPLVLIAVAGHAATFEASGGFQNGRALFLRDDELHLPWRGYAHELVHLVEEARDWQLPWSWSEGLACAVALDVALRDFSGIEGPTREAERLATLAREGDAYWRPGWRGRNPLLPWAGSDPAERRAAYDWATVLVRGAASCSADGFTARLVAALERSPPAALAGSAEPAATERFLAALELAAAADLGDLFRATGVRD